MSASSALPRHLGGNTGNAPGAPLRDASALRKLCLVASLYRKIKRVTRRFFSGLCYENTRGRLSLSQLLVAGLVRIFGFTYAALQLRESLPTGMQDFKHQNRHTPGQSTTRYFETGHHLVWLSRIRGFEEYWLSLYCLNHGWKPELYLDA